MPLKEQLDQDLKTAMRAKDENRLSAIRMVKAAISNLEIARTDPKNIEFKKPLTEEDLIGVVERQIKQRREAIELYEKGNRPELAAKEAAEISALEGYVPKQMTRDEIKTEVEAIISQLETKDFAKVMRQAATRLKGKADGRTVNQVVKEMTG